MGCHYVFKSIPWTKSLWDVQTWLPLTGSRNQRDFPKIELMKRACGTTVETAERYDININIEVHGYFTTNPEF